MIILGHDVSIEGVLSALGDIRNFHVPYASRLIFEQWADSDENIYFRLLLNGDPVKIEKDPALKISGLIKMQSLLELLRKRQKELFLIDSDFAPESLDTLCSKTYIQNLLSNIQS